MPDEEPVTTWQPKRGPIATAVIWIILVAIALSVAGMLVAILL